MPTFKDLRIWQEAMRLMTEIDEISKTLPYKERFRLKDQSIRSSSSVPDNIAEGYTAYYYKEKIRRFYDARKEAGETQNHVLKMKTKGYIDTEISDRLFNRYQKLIKGINGYINYIRRKREDKRIGD